ncbi:MAG: hypothetical protein Q8M62_11260 [Algoriphagus sp.]|uniref:hypothetical protein n=1 Tax=Algoriphagus sp. TaxID=1872435 RepID=UPI002734609B|nr:hypothetical protein [Algoriphagus sp.]MDP3200400.1 hypothetical protein [Algoriphagus sp.]
MKKLLLFIFILGIICNLSAQPNYSIPNDSAGIYLTYNDFVNGKPINSFKPYQKNYSLWPKGFFKYKDPELKTPDTTIIYKRSDIWGYTDHKGRLIRTFGNNHYKVLCDKGLIIYIIYSPTSVSYHFSKTLNDTVHRLSRKNLTIAYADNTDLLQKIKSSKKKDWLIWDEKKECYLLNRLFEE